MSYKEYTNPEIGVLVVALERGFEISYDDGNLESPEDGGEI